MNLSLSSPLFIATISGLVIMGLVSLSFFYLKGGKPSGGISKLSIRAVGIVLVIVVAAVLAVLYESAVTAAVGLLGAVAGYLFGSTSGDNQESNATTGDIFGNNTKVAGRDIIEKLESLETTIENYEQSVTDAAANKNSGFHIHEERISWGQPWLYTEKITSGITLAHERVLSKFPSPEFELVNVTTIHGSDFVHINFVFSVRALGTGLVTTSLNEHFGSADQ